MADTSIGNRSLKLVHGVYSYGDQTEGALVANCKDVDTGENILKIVPNYERPFWVTKPPFRTHKYHKEYAVEKEELDGYVVSQNEMANRISKIFNKPPSKYNTINRLCSNIPYIYGADISPVLIEKKKLADARNYKSITSFDTGFLDIEQSLLGNHEIILITYVDSTSQKIYTGILKPFLQDFSIEHINELYLKKMNEIKETLKPEALEIFNKQKYTTDIRMFDKEINVIRFIFKAIHHHKPNFVGIWNIAYDIPEIISRIEHNGYDPASIMCHPEVPEKFRMLKLLKDRNPNKHWADLWHWFYLSGYTQFYDALPLYSILRAQEGRETSYKLDDILKKEIGGGKLDLDCTHQKMQRDHMDYYTVYNIYDAVGIDIMEKKNNDVVTLNQLVTDHGLLENFGNQTVQLKNMFYCYCRTKGWVPAAVGKSDMKMEGDEKIHNVGGNVLHPLQTRNTGVPILEEMSSMETGLCMFVCDLDVSS